MVSHSEDYDFAITEMIIESFRERPMFYDKDSEEYHTRWRDRHEELNKIAADIKEVYKIDITGEQVDKQWKNLVSHLKKELKAQKAYTPSGSAASANYTSKWEYFDHMKWLGKHLAHLPHFATDAGADNDEGVDNKRETSSTNKYRRTRRSADAVDKLVEQSSKLINFLEKQGSCDPALEKEEQCKKAVDRYINFIDEGFKKIPGDWEKFMCAAEVLEFIEEKTKK